MSPVFVLTTGPRLILTLTVFIGLDQATFELLPNLLFDFVAAVRAAFVETLPEDCISVFGCFLRWLAEFRLDLRDTTVYVLVSPVF